MNTKDIQLILIYITGTLDPEESYKVALKLAKMSGCEKIGKQYIVKDLEKLESILINYDVKVEKFLYRQKLYTLENLLKRAQCYYHEHYEV